MTWTVLLVGVAIIILCPVLALLLHRTLQKSS
jgi:hypothetical protein